MATARVPRPYGAHHDAHHHLHPHSHGDPPPTAPGHHSPRPAGATQMALHAPSSQLAPFQFPPKTGIHVRYIYTFTGAPACEVWKNGQRVDPPPGLIKRADPTKKDCFFRVGDMMYTGSVSEHALRAFGFSDPGSSVWTALLFFVADIEPDEYRVIYVFRAIVPDLHDQWKGKVEFRRCIVAGSTILPFPKQTDIYHEEDLTVHLIYWELAEELAWIGKVLEGFTGYFLDLLWGLTGGWEVKVAGEVAEKYVAREVLRRALKFIRPKFLVLVKGYVTGFVKEMVKQVFHVYVYMIRTSASNALMSRTGAAGNTITVDQIHWLQSSSKLSQATDQASIHWVECHKEGIKEALTPFWTLFSGSAMAKGPLRRFVTACFESIDKFFFDLGLLKVIKSAEGVFGKPIGDKIKELIAGVMTDWMKEVGESPKGMSEAASENRIRDLTLRKLTDGTLVELAWKYIQDNWENLAKGALDKVEGELIKAVRGATEGAAGGTSK